MDASPEMQTYSCGVNYYYGSWTVCATGSWWKVDYGDGYVSGTFSMATTSTHHNYWPDGYCVDYYPLFWAHDNYGNNAYDGVRVSYTY